MYSELSHLLLNSFCFITNFSGPTMTHPIIVASIRKGHYSLVNLYCNLRYWLKLFNTKNKFLNIFHKLQITILGELYSFKFVKSRNWNFLSFLCSNTLWFLFFLSWVAYINCLLWFISCTVHFVSKWSGMW